jgi:hypothetical protein
MSPTRTWFKFVGYHCGLGDDIDLAAECTAKSRPSDLP